MCVHAEEERAVDTGSLAVVADGLRNGGDMGVIETGFQRRATMSGCPERDFLVWNGDVRRVGIIPADKIRNVENKLFRDGLSSERGWHGGSFKLKMDANYLLYLYYCSGHRNFDKKQKS